MRKEEHLTSPGATLGTVAYMSPEQVRGKELLILGSGSCVCFRLPGDFGQTKVQNFGKPSTGNENVARLDVAMNYSLGMRRIESVRDFNGQRQQVLEASAPTSGYDCPYRSTSSCVFSGWENGQLIFYKLDPAQGKGKELARTKLGQPADMDWKISSDGSRVAVFGGDQPGGHVRIVELEAGSEDNLQLPHGWSIWNLRWTSDGKALLVAAQSKTTGYLIARIGLDGKSTVLLDRGRNQWLGNPCPSPDGRRLAFSQQTFETNAYLLENF